MQKCHNIRTTHSFHSFYYHPLESSPGSIILLLFDGSCCWGPRRWGAVWRKYFWSDRTFHSTFWSQFSQTLCFLSLLRRRFMWIFTYHLRCDSLVLVASESYWRIEICRQFQPVNFEFICCDSTATLNSPCIVWLLCLSCNRHKTNPTYWHALSLLHYYADVVPSHPSAPHQFIHIRLILRRNGRIKVVCGILFHRR